GARAAGRAIDAPAHGDERCRAPARRAGARAGQPAHDFAGRRADRQSRQRHGRRNHESAARDQRISGHDDCDGHARTAACRTLRAPADSYGRRQSAQRRALLMKRRALGELAFRNLREAALRNSLTTLGIAVGVASLVAMLSLGVGLQNLASDRLSRTGLFDAIFVPAKPNTPTLRRMENPSPAPLAPVRPLDEDGRHQLEALPNVIAVYPEIRFPTEIHYAGNPYATIVA